MTLGDLRINAKARILAIESGEPGLEEKLREAGFMEGDEVEVLGAGPFGNATLAVRLNRTIIAMRKDEAAAIKIACET
jgi:ferrous iron transport protein A